VPVDHAAAFRVILVTMGAIASARTLNIAFRILAKKIQRMQYRKIQPIFTKLYKDVNAFEISVDHRNEQKIKSDEFTYGEIVPSSFAEIMSIVKPRSNEIFYDLGCGSGKVVFLAALLYDDLIIRGVEVLPPLHELCLELKQKLKGIISKSRNFKGRPLPIEFINEDLITMDYSDGDIVFLNATCYEDDTWGKKICKNLDKLKVGARVIMTTKTTESKKFELIHANTHLMSWGMNSVNIYRKIK